MEGAFLMSSVLRSLWLLWITVASLAAQPVTRFIDPAVTDSAIDQWLEPHLVSYDPSIPHRQQLFVFLPGSFGQPRHYQQLLRMAARLGLYVIGLRYPNSWTVYSLCSESPDSACHFKVRFEIVEGVDLSPLVDITPANSIHNRLRALLQYLVQRFPNEGWEQFLDEDGDIRWERVLVGGHSQGGGHAALIGKFYRVARVLMFAWSDLWKENGQWRLAPWVDSLNATPSNAFVGFAHVKDALLANLAAWRGLGLAQFGPPVLVDTVPPPYRHSHQLLTDVTPARSGAYHGSVATDYATPLDSNGVPILAPVWAYMLLGDATTVPTPAESSAVSSLSTARIVRIGTPLPLPSPLPPQSVIELWSPIGQRFLLLPRTSGVAASSAVWQWTGKDFAGAPIPPGIYVLRILTPQQAVVQQQVILWLP